MAGDEAAPPPAETAGAGQQPEIATLIFNDGSKYTGTLKTGTPHGLGTCIWKDGNQYDGEWKNGVMHGFGTYLWTSGQRYDGEWKDGKREGVGVKMYADGSTFHGIWRDGRKHGVGVFKPAAKDKDKERNKSVVKTTSGRLMLHNLEGESTANLRAFDTPPQQQQHPQQPQPETPRQADAYSKDSMHEALGQQQQQAEHPEHPQQAQHQQGGAPVAPSVVSNVSDAGAERDRQKERDKDREQEREKEKEGKMVFIRAFEDGVLRREEKLSSEDAKMIFGQPQTSDDKGRGSKARKKVKRALGFGKKLQQKHGQLLYKGMPGYNLMLRLQQGIRWSVGRGWYGSPPEQSPPLHPQQSPNSVGGGAGGANGPIPLSHVLKPSDFTEKVKLFFPSAGSSTTPAHPAGDFKWKDYSPRVFRNLRNMYGIADADYMLSLGGSSALWQLNSPGKSGCMFFLSDDERFLVKTMRKTEIRTLIDMLPRYYTHMEGQPQNLVIRFFGVHGVKQVHGRTVRFVVMHNMFNTDLQIHKKFDLKGSTEGRTTGPKVNPNDSKTVFKDLDLDMQFLLEPSTHSALIRQIHSDAEFLREVDVMDYSLLLGIHFSSRARAAMMQEQDAALAAAAAAANQLRQPPGAPHQIPQQQQQQHPQQQAAGGPAAGSHGPAARVRDTAGPPGLPADREAALEQSRAGEGVHGQRVSPSRNGPPLSPSTRVAAAGGAGGGGAGGDDPDGDHVRNFDLFSDRPDLDKQLRVFEERMRGLGYGEQRIQDILSLARLRILGDQLKKRSKAYKVYDGPTTVLQALASRRHGPDGSLPRLEEGEEPQSDDDGEEGPQGPAKQPHCLGYQMRALAVHTRGAQPPEEVILCFGIIDILQDWNLRKVFERTFKSLTRDSHAISVAPPKLYSLRFADFLAKEVFMDPEAGAAKGLTVPPLAASLFAQLGAGGVTTIEEEGDLEHR